MTLFSSSSSPIYISNAHTNSNYFFETFIKKLVLSYNMKVKFESKTRKIGNSLGLLIPDYFVKAAFIKKQDIVEVVLNVKK